MNVQCEVYEILLLSMNGKKVRHFWPILNIFQNKFKTAITNIKIKI